MEWININDRLPEIDEDVLLLTDGGVIEGNRCNKTYMWEFIQLCIHVCGCCSSEDDIVTHWQPLPKEPGISSEDVFNKIHLPKSNNMFGSYWDDVWDNW